MTPLPTGVHKVVQGVAGPPDGPEGYVQLMLELEGGARLMFALSRMEASSLGLRLQVVSGMLSPGITSHS